MNHLTTYAPDRFVGREGELTELRSALNDARSGRGRMVMLSGELGIGKTRTSETFTDEAAESGFVAVWGRCSEQRGAPAYWPWIQTVRACIARFDAEPVRSALGLNAGVIAEAVPEVAIVVPDFKPPPPINDPDAGRFRLYDAITSFLRALSMQEPLVLVLDDLHWADDASLRLLEFVVQARIESQIMMLGTYRDTDVNSEHPLFRTLGDLTRNQLFSRISLDGLDEAGVGEMLEAQSGGAPTDEISVAIHERTAGNPLFVGEMARYLDQEGMLPGDANFDASKLVLPNGVREVIGRRISLISPYGRQVLNLASVLGREFTLVQLVALEPGRSPDQMLDVLGEALTSRLVEELPAEVGRYQFTHAMVQQVLREDLELVERVNLHARVAEALEEVYGERTDQNAAELAYHYSEAEPVLGTDKLVHYSIIAGEQSLDNFAFEDAMAHFSRAIDVQESDELNEIGARIHRGIGLSQVGRGQIVEAGDSFGKAFDFYFVHENYEAATELMVQPMYDYQRLDTAERIGKILKVVEPASIEEAKLQARYAVALGFDPDSPDDDADEALERAIEISRVRGDVNVELWALSQLMLMLVERGDHLEAFAVGQDAMKLAEKADDPVALFEIGALAAPLCMVYGESELAKQYVERTRVPLQRVSTPFREVQFALSNLCNLDSGGEYDAFLIGSRSVEQLLDDAEMNFSFENVVYLMMATARVHIERGNFEEGQRCLDKGLKFSEKGAENLGPLHVIGQIFHITRNPDHLRLAKIQLPRLDAKERYGGINQYDYMVLNTLIRIDDDYSGSPDENYQLFGKFIPPIHGYFGLSSARIAGLLCHHEGRHSESFEHFEASLEFCRRNDYKPELAWTCHDYVEAMLEDHKTADRIKVDALLDEGLALTEEVGMPPLQSRLEALRELAHTLRMPHPGGLTNREFEILGLIAAGKRNAEICDELFITINTVDRHVTNIYSKTGSANRAEATAWAIDKGITASV